MNKYRHASDKLFIAVEILVTGSDDIYSRLADAHADCLSKLGQREIPAASKVDLMEAMAVLPKKVTALTLRKKLTIDMAIRLAKAILTTYNELAEFGNYEEGFDDCDKARRSED